MQINKFTDLTVWQESHKLVLLIYNVTKKFPSEEKFSLTNQIRRAVVSVTSNIAEGFGRQTKTDTIHFYIMARGSLLELQNQIIIAKDINIITEDEFNIFMEQAVISHKLLNGLIRSIKNAQ